MHCLLVLTYNGSNHIAVNCSLDVSTNEHVPNDIYKTPVATATAYNVNLSDATTQPVSGEHYIGNALLPKQAATTS